MSYMQTVSRTGVCFLVYSTSPVSLICSFSDTVLVLGPRGSVLYYGDLAEAKRTLFDPYYREEPHYNALDCLYHVVRNEAFRPKLAVEWRYVHHPLPQRRFPLLLHVGVSSGVSSSVQSLLYALDHPAPPPTSSPGLPPVQLNPFTKRITEIRETVTKVKRVPFVASRLKKSITRKRIALWHSCFAIFVGLLLGLMFNNLPQNRLGIEKRENLFHIIVALRVGSHVVCDFLDGGDLVQFV